MAEILHWFADADLQALSGLETLVSEATRAHSLIAHKGQASQKRQRDALTASNGRSDPAWLQH